VVSVWRYISVGSMTAGVVFLVCLFLFDEDPLGSDLALTILAAVVALLIIVRHRSNIRRLLAGTENKVGRDRQQTAQPTSQEGTTA